MVRFRNQSIDPSLDLPCKTFLVPRLTGTEFCANAFVPSVSSTTYQKVNIWQFTFLHEASNISERCWLLLQWRTLICLLSLEGIYAIHSSLFCISS